MQIITIQSVLNQCISKYKKTHLTQKINNGSSFKYKILDPEVLFRELKKTDDAFNQYYEKLYASLSNSSHIYNSTSKESFVEPVTPLNITPDKRHFYPRLIEQKESLLSTSSPESQEEINNRKKSTEDEEINNINKINMSGVRSTEEHTKQKKSLDKKKISLIKSKIQWTKELDVVLLKAVEEFGPSSWESIASIVKKSSKQCSERWYQHVNPKLDKSNFTHEEITIIREEGKYKNWAEISKKLQKVTNRKEHHSTNQIKNYWNVHFKKLNS